MPKRTTTAILPVVLGIGIALTQFFDIIIHATTDQLEPLRVSSNIVVLLWLAIVAYGKLGTKLPPIAIGSIGAYLVLNVVFLLLEGFTNPEQGGALRSLLFLLVLLTLALSSLLAIFRRNKAA